MNEKHAPLITNDAVVLGILITILGIIFITSSSNKSFYKKFYTIVPSVLLCYFLPALLNTFNIISGETSNLYKIASRYLLPASLVLLTLSIDFKELKKLGNKAGLNNHCRQLDRWWSQPNGDVRSFWSQ
jgi:uncharacterized membrane protein